MYLDYENYAEIGGTLDLSAFSRNIDRACRMIDVRTFDRLKEFEEIPQTVRNVCADLVEFIATNTVNKPTSKSQSVGSVSESVSYANKTAEDYEAELNRIFEPLETIKSANGTPITYRGAIW